MSLPDQQARDRIRDDLEATLLVEAGAGSGKTTALVGRIARLLVSGRVTIDEVCAITFTRKAAGELRLRLRETLEHVRRDGQGDEPRRAARALARLEGAAVGTIHGFAATILRERPLEARLDPAFRVEDESLARLGAHCHEWLTRGLDRDDPLLRRYLVGHGGSELALLGTLRTLWDHRDLQALGPDQQATAWDRAAVTTDLIARVRALGAALDPVLERDSKTFAKLEPLLSLAHALAVDDGDDLDRHEARLLALDFDVYGKSKLVEADRWSIPPEQARALRDDARRLRDDLDAYVEAARLDLAQRLVPALADLLCDPHDPDCAQSRLRRAGILDSLGLLLEARDLVRDDLRVRQAFQARYPVILVDELQDTDPLQVELIALLAAPRYAGADWREALQHVDPGRLFLVGDPKQSIYRFRRADLSLYAEIQQRLAGEVVRLTSNFRSRPGIAELVNVAFAEVLAQLADHQPAYAPIDAQRPPSTRGPAVHWLDLNPRRQQDRPPRVAAIRDAEPDAIADFLARSLRVDGVDPPDPLWVCAGDDPAERIAEPRDVAFLFRQFVSRGRDLTARYVEALAARGIPAVLFAGSSFRDREEVDAAITALRAIERPDDPIAVYAALKGPFFAHPEPALLGRDLSAPWRLDPRQRPPLWVDESLRASLRLLGELHAARNHVPIARTVQRLYDHTRALGAQATLPAGARRVANLSKLQRLARDFDQERGEATSFRAFVRRLDELEAEADSPLAEEGRGGVRFLSLHKAKGLEFPIVYLADPTTQARKGGIPVRRVYRREANQVVVSVGQAPLPDAERQHEETAETAESERLLYVAATRARDALILPRVRDYQDTRFDRLALRLVPHLQRLAGLSPSPIRQVGPAPAPDRAPAPPREPPTPDAYRAWAAARAEALTAAAAPSQPTLSVTARCQVEAESAAGPGAGPAQLELFGATPAPPAGPIAFPTPELAADFGTFVHLLLYALPLDADPQRVRAYASTLVRRSPELRPYLDEACSQVEWALAHPLLDRARDATDCRRELPVSGLAPDGVLVEGVVDLVFFSPDGPVLVDHKTGAPDPKHTQQLRLYAELLGAPTAECWALYTASQQAAQV